MALGILRGPAGAGKSQELEPGILRADLTALWAALFGYERGSDGRYPVRSADEAALASYLKAALVRYAAREGLTGWVTTSDSSAEAVERLREQGATGPVRTVDPGEEVVRERLAGPDGQVSDDCNRAIDRWYRRSSLPDAPGAGARAAANIAAALAAARRRA